MKSLFFLTFLLQMVVLQAQVTKQQIAESLPGKLVHPYLFFNDQEKNTILQLIKNDGESKLIYDRLFVEANRLMYTAIEKFPPQTDHPRYDSDGRYDRQIGEYSRAAMSLAFLYQLTGEPRYAQKSFEFADALAELPNWIIKAHEFSIIYDRVWPWNSNLNDDKVVFSYDIRTAATGIDIALVYDWCYNALDKHQRDRIRNALYEKVILPVRNNYDYQWWATSYKCNWCGICFSGLGLASLALLTEDQSLTDVVAESYNRIGLYLDELDVDGGWQEGRGYWAYGMSESIYFMESLRKLTNSRCNLLNHKKIQNHPIDFALYGLTGNFGDGNGTPVGPTFLINKLVEQTKNGEGAWYRNHFLNEGSSIFDLIWPRAKVNETAPKTASKHFKSIDWAFMRTDFLDPANVTVACKAGNNDDPHHGHLDVGQFMVYWQNNYFIRDLGNINYDEQYFTEDRWNYPNASSLGHNLIFVNGEQQKSAKYKDQPWEQGVGGKILDFRTSAKRDYTLIDATNAYPQKQLKKWRRHIVLEKPDITLVLDEIFCSPGSEIEARFFPGVENQKSDSNFTLLTDGEGHTMAVIPFCADNLNVVESKLPFLPVKKEAKTLWIPYFSTELVSSRKITYLGTLILPVKNSEDVGIIVASLKLTENNENLSVSFSRTGQNFSYKFENENGEIVFKNEN